MAELLTNPGFETGDLTGWTTTGSAIVRTYSVRTGTYSLGYGAGDYTAYQDVDLTSIGSHVDGGYVSATLSTYCRNGGIGEGDTLRVRLQYLDVSSSVIAEDDTGTISGNVSWTQYTDTRTCPNGTRKLRVYLYGSQGGVSYSDIFFDDCSVMIVDTAPPETPGIINFI